MSAAQPQVMQCMEVWGGNQVVDSSVVMAGLDAWVYCKPFHDAPGGGDVYYVSSCATGRITRLLVADVSGHGAAVCDTAGELRSLMRRYVNHIDQSRFVQSMNQQFFNHARNGCFATAVVTTFFSPTRELSLCNAGHPPPLLYRVRERQWSFLQQERSKRQIDFPLGIEDGSEYAEFHARLNVGDLVLCYTDSLIEWRSRDGEFLGLAGLLRILQSVDVSDPARLIPSLISAIEAEAEGNLTSDDVTMLLFRPNGLAPRVTLANKLLAPLRVMRGIARALKAGTHMPLPEVSVKNLGGALLDPLNGAAPGDGNIG